MGVDKQQMNPVRLSPTKPINRDQLWPKNPSFNRSIRIEGRSERLTAETGLSANARWPLNPNQL
jgi:hypothetical protein